jgi:uncharacterized repeat protein (TIGR03803 family)
MATLIFALVPGALAEGKFKTLHKFTGGKDGANSYANLISDAEGNLYGTTAYGGAYADGTVFELTPQGNGKWAEKVLHDFNGKDGCVPEAGLTLDAAGNLFGTTSYGGSGANVYCVGDYPGNGTVFELTPTANGEWTEEVLHKFKNDGKDGYYPAASLTFDARGNLYGTTQWGGVNKVGTVFELTRGKNGTWTEKVLHSFLKEADPQANLIFDRAGNLFGTTNGGGNNCNGDVPGGAVFELTPGANGKWAERVIHWFNCTDGAGPVAGLIFDTAGDLYGTTYWGGVSSFDCDNSSCGVAFELIPGAGGNWTEKVLHRFHDYAADGVNPASNLIFDAAGNLYGTAGGGAYRVGTVFQLARSKNGTWTEKVLHNFDGKTGSGPAAALILDAVGNLYGTASAGGNYGSECPPWGCGVVFDVIP